jgi:ABC-type phosphate transport system auxiliary subunit
MVVTAKLSRKFYERFGDDLTNELVEWMNQVDATYRAELRDLFEAHFGRFNATLGELRAELRAEFRGEIGALQSDLRGGIGALQSDLRGALGELRQELVAQRGDLGREIAGVRTEIAASRAESLRWNILLWIGALGTVVAVLKL